MTKKKSRIVTNFNGRPLKEVQGFAFVQAPCGAKRPNTISRASKRQREVVLESNFNVLYTGIENHFLILSLSDRLSELGVFTGVIGDVSITIKRKIGNRSILEDAYTTVAKECIPPHVVVHLLLDLL